MRMRCMALCRGGTVCEVFRTVAISRSQLCRPIAMLRLEERAYSRVGGCARAEAVSYLASCKTLESAAAGSAPLNRAATGKRVPEESRKASDSTAVVAVKAAPAEKHQ